MLAYRLQSRRSRERPSANARHARKVGDMAQRHVKHRKQFVEEDKIRLDGECAGVPLAHFTRQFHRIFVEAGGAKRCAFCGGLGVRSRSTRHMSTMRSRYTDVGKEVCAESNKINTDRLNTGATKRYIVDLRQPVSSIPSCPGKLVAFHRLQGQGHDAGIAPNTGGRRRAETLVTLLSTCTTFCKAFHRACSTRSVLVE